MCSVFRCNCRPPILILAMTRARRCDFSECSILYVHSNFRCVGRVQLNLSSENALSDESIEPSCVKRKPSPQPILSTSCSTSWIIDGNRSRKKRVSYSIETVFGERDRALAWACEWKEGGKVVTIGMQNCNENNVYPGVNFQNPFIRLFQFYINFFLS